MEAVGTAILSLLLHAAPVACVAWTVCHEEVFREVHEYCARCAKECRRWWQRKFFYLFTCEYCFSHWVTLAMIVAFDFRLFYEDWRGYPLAFFSVPWVANFYMSIYNRIRVDLRKERAEADLTEKKEKEVHS